MTRFTECIILRFTAFLHSVRCTHTHSKNIAAMVGIATKTQSIRMLLCLVRQVHLSLSDSNSKHKQQQQQLLLCVRVFPLDLNNQLFFICLLKTHWHFHGEN